MLPKNKEANVMRKNTVANSVNTYLEQNNISEGELSRLTGVPEKTIRSQLTGKKAFYIDDVICFCKALNTPLEVFNCMSDYRQSMLREIIKCRFWESKGRPTPWEEVAYELCFHRVHIMRLYKDALNKIAS